jgi:nuclear GTP-binding protein
MTKKARGNAMDTSQHWQDVFKVVLTNTDVVLEILDARNPPGTHNRAIEDFIRQHRPEVQVLLLLNKVDLIPHRVLVAWLAHFEALGYRIMYISARHNRGILEVLKVLRGIRNTLGKKAITATIVGYPNTGKSTLIQGLSENRKKVGISSVAGYTRGIMTIKLSNSLYLVDTPGIIPLNENDETELGLKACMRADKLDDPLAVVEAIWDLVGPAKLSQKYDIALLPGDDVDEFIQKVGRKMGRLKRGGEVNETDTALQLVHDWQKNKIKYYVPPPNLAEAPDSEEDDEDESELILDGEEAEDGDFVEEDD